MIYFAIFSDTYMVSTHKPTEEHPHGKPDDWRSLAYDPKTGKWDSLENAGIMCSAHSQIFKAKLPFTGHIQAIQYGK